MIYTQVSMLNVVIIAVIMGLYLLSMYLIKVIFTSEKVSFKKYIVSGVNYQKVGSRRFMIILPTFIVYVGSVTIFSQFFDSQYCMMLIGLSIFFNIYFCNIFCFKNFGVCNDCTFSWWYSIFFIRHSYL